jgi:ribosomal protein S21
MSNKTEYQKSPDEGPVDFMFEKMLKKFLREVKKEGVLEEVKRRQRYTKPSAIRRLKMQGKWKKF